MIVSTSLMIGDMSESVASRSRSRTSSPCSVSRTSEMRKPEAASCNTSSQCAREFVETLEIGWICHRDVQAFLISLQRYELVPDHQIDRNFSKEIVVDGRFAIVRQKIDEW